MLYKGQSTIVNLVRSALIEVILNYSVPLIIA